MRIPTRAIVLCFALLTKGNVIGAVLRISGTITDDYANNRVPSYIGTEVSLLVESQYFFATNGLPRNYPGVGGRDASILGAFIGNLQIFGQGPARLLWDYPESGDQGDRLRYWVHAPVLTANFAQILEIPITEPTRTTFWWDLGLGYDAALADPRHPLDQLVGGYYQTGSLSFEALGWMMLYPDGSFVGTPYGFVADGITIVVVPEYCSSILFLSSAVFLLFSRHGKSKHSPPRC